MALQTLYLAQIEELRANEEEYEEQINALQLNNRNLEFQIKDLKTFILTQKTLYEKQEEKLTERIQKLEQQLNNLNSLNPEASLQQKKVFLNSNQTSQWIQTQISNYFCNYLSNFRNIEKIVQQKTKCYQTKLMVFHKLIKQLYAQNQELRRELNFKNKQQLQQKKYLDDLARDKMQSEQFYKKQIDFIQSLYNEKKQTCDKLQKANQELYQNYTNSRICSPLKKFHKREKSAIIHIECEIDSPTKIKNISILNKKKRSPAQILKLRKTISQNELFDLTRAATERSETYQQKVNLNKYKQQSCQLYQTGKNMQSSKQQTKYKKKLKPSKKIDP